MGSEYQELGFGHHHHVHDVESQSSSANYEFIPEFNDNSSDDFWFLPEMALLPKISAQTHILCDFHKQNAPQYGKRKVRDVADEESQMQDQQGDQSKRTRSTKIHNISERKRRDRINTKVKALQELIPHCGKKDRASILEDAAEYIKALKLQVETMAKGECGVPYETSNIASPRLSTVMGIRPAMGMGVPYGGERMLGVVGYCAHQYAPVFQLASPPAGTAGLTFSPPAVAAFPFPSTMSTGNCFEGETPKTNKDA